MRGGMERRYESLLRDATWNRTADSVAANEPNPCLIEKSLYAEARKGRYAGLADFALRFKVIYERQAAIAEASSPLQKVPPGIVLTEFHQACKSLCLPCSDAAHKFKDVAKQSLRCHALHNDWGQSSSGDALNALFNTFFGGYVLDKLNEALFKAQEAGHGSHENLRSSFIQTFSQVRLDNLVEALLSGQEKSVRAPRCANPKEDLRESML